MASAIIKLINYSFKKAIPLHQNLKKAMNIKSPSSGIVTKIREGKNDLQITIKSNLLDSHNQYCPIYGKIKNHYRIPSTRVFIKTEIDSPIGKVSVNQLSLSNKSKLKSFIGNEMKINTSERLSRISYGSETKIKIPKGKVDFSKNIKKGSKVVGGITDLGFFEYS